MYIQRELTLNFGKKLYNQKKLLHRKERKTKWTPKFKSSRQSVTNLNYVTAPAKFYSKYEKEAAFSSIHLLALYMHIDVC